MDSAHAETAAATTPAAPSSLQEMKLTEAENEQNKHAYSVALATAMAAEAAVAAAKAAAEVVRLTAAARFSGKSKEEIAAIKIQTAFRAYMVRSSAFFGVQTCFMILCVHRVLAGSHFSRFRCDEHLITRFSIYHLI